MPIDGNKLFQNMLKGSDKCDRTGQQHPDATAIWDRIVKMGANSYFEEGSPDWVEASRCRIAGYIRALVDFGILPKEKEKEICLGVWNWVSWNRDQLKGGRMP